MNNDYNLEKLNRSSDLQFENTKRGGKQNECSRTLVDNSYSSNTVRDDIHEEQIT